VKPGSLLAAMCSHLAPYFSMYSWPPFPKISEAGGPLDSGLSSLRIL
jgi:hypothetical protein